MTKDDLRKEALHSIEPDSNGNVESNGWEWTHKYWPSYRDENQDDVVAASQHVECE
jgi:hypothetical protein